MATVATLGASGAVVSAVCIERPAPEPPRRLPPGEWIGEPVRRVRRRHPRKAHPLPLLRASRPPAAAAAAGTGGSNGGGERDDLDDARLGQRHDVPAPRRRCGYVT